MAIELLKNAYGDLATTISRMPVDGGDFNVDQIKAQAQGTMVTNRAVIGMTEEQI